MRARTLIGRGAAASVAGVLVGWLTWSTVAWTRYGHVRREPRRDALIDCYLPAYEVAETHETRVAAPAALTYAVATGMGMEASAIVRTIIHARERLLRVRGGSPWPPGGIVAQMRAWGWGVLAEVPERELVLGTVTQPWQSNVQFRALSPDEFTAFDSAGFVKIVSTISVEPLGPDSSMARTQTRVATTDPTARARFRRYWAAFSPGILLIRRALLRRVKREAERRHRGARAQAARAGVPATAPVPRSMPVRAKAAQ